MLEVFQSLKMTILEIEITAPKSRFQPNYLLLNITAKKKRQSIVTPSPSSTKVILTLE